MGDDVREAIRELAALGPFPSEQAASDADVEPRDLIVQGLEEPATDAEADVLIGLLGEDEFFEGLAAREAQRPGAQAADAARRQFEHGRLGLAGLVSPLGLGRHNQILTVAGATALLPLVLLLGARSGRLPRPVGALLVVAYVATVALLLAR